MPLLEQRAVLFLQVETVAIQPFQLYRVVSTESMLKSAWSVDVLKNQTLNALFTFPPEGITDAIEELLASNHSKLEPIAGGDIFEREGPPLSPKCRVAGTTVEARICIGTSALARTTSKGEQEELGLSINAEGVESFEASYMVSTSLRRAGNATFESSVTQELKGEAISAFGQLVRWKNVSAPATLVTLSYEQQSFQSSNDIIVEQQWCHEVRAEMSTSVCPADGDTLVTSIRFGSSRNTTIKPDEVQIETNVKAAISCALSKTWVEGEAYARRNVSRPAIGDDHSMVVQVSSSLRLRVLAFDADEVPISTFGRSPADNQRLN
jgi:hypothetical protein